MKKITKLLIPIALFPVIIVTISIFFIIENNKLPTIQNLSSYTSKYESNNDVINSILNSLNETLKQNTDKKPSTINDIFIRDDSFSQTQEEGNYHTSFIIDIDSLQQSYKISYIWNQKNKLSASDDGYNGSFLCLSNEDNKKYPNFNCNDISTAMTGTNDPDAKKLPHIVEGKYRLTYNIKAKKVTLDIFACIDTYTDKIEEEAKEWLKENNISLKKLFINYCVTN